MMEMETDRRNTQPPSAEEVLEFMSTQYGGDDTPEPQSPKYNAEAIMAKLAEPFRRDQISQRKIGGRMLDYVEGHEYIARLNDASPAWSFRMTGHEFRDLNVKRWNDQTRQSEPVVLPCLTVYGELTIPGVGTRAGIGVQMIEDNAGEDVMKGALTDCLKNCAKYFGLGLHMYSGDAPAPAEHRSTGSPRHEAPRQGSAHDAPSGSAQRPNDSAGQFDTPQPGTGGPATKPQKGRLWHMSGKDDSVVAAWAAEYGETLDTLTKGTASLLIDTKGE